MISQIKKKFYNFTSDEKFAEILTGSIWALIARIVATILGLILSIIVVRFYGADIMGLLSVLQSFLGLATIFTVLGTKTSILRLIPEHIAKYSATSAFKLYRKTQYLVIAFSIFTGSIFYFSANFIADKIFSKPTFSFYLGLSAIFIVFKSMMLLNTQAVRGLRLIKMFALMQVLPTAANLIFLLILTMLHYSKGNPVYTMLISLSFTGIIGWITMEHAFKKRMKKKDYVKTIPIRNILSISFPMLMTATMSFVIGQTGIIMLGMYRSEEEVGYFAIAVKLATLTSFALAAINSMAGPKFSELFHSGRIEELFYTAKKSAKLVFWTTSPILIFFALFGKFLLQWFYGNDFVVAYPALVIVAIGQFVNSIAGSTGMFLNMTGNQIVLRNFILISALANIAINLILIPSIGIYGASIASMISLSFWNIAALLFIKSKYGNSTGYFPYFLK